MLKVGLAGGIGSGKSLICRIFQAIGIPVYHADQQAHILAENDAAIRKRITDLLGPEAYLAKSYNRKFVADAVFSDREKLHELNEIIHPAVAADFNKWVSLQKDVPYAIEEAAILFESGAYQRMDYSIYVDASEDLRIHRVIKRDKVTREEVELRVKNQMPADKILPLADWVVYNNEIQLVLPQILHIHSVLIRSNNSNG